MRAIQGLSINLISSARCSHEWHLILEMKGKKKLPSFWRSRQPLKPEQRRPLGLAPPSPRGAAFGVAGPGSPGGPSEEGVPLFQSQPGTWWDFLQSLTLAALCRARPRCCLQVRGRAAEGANPPGNAALFKCVVVWNLFHMWQINER